MALQTWKCLNCEKKFESGKWLCADGQTNHVVERKTYLLADAPSDPGHPAPGSTISVALREGRTVICNIPPPKKVMEGDAVKWVGEGSVEFIRGEYATSDPELQYWLDRKGGFCGTFLDSDPQDVKDMARAGWNRAWLTEGQQLLLERQNVEAMRHRLENERNELLAETKRRVSA